MHESRIPPIDPPYTDEIQDAFDKIMPEGMSPLIIFRTFANHPAILKMQELIRDGTLGKIHYMYSNRLNIGKIRSEENILWSFAPHDISVMLSLLDEMPTRVSCQRTLKLMWGTRL